MLIKVTKQHIDGGIKCNPHVCPISLAIDDVVNCNRAFSEREMISVGSTKIRIGDITYQSPKSVVAFVWIYDDDGYVEPFEFELN